MSAKEIRNEISEAGLGTDGILDIWYNPGDDEIRINQGDWAEPALLQQWSEALEGCCSVISTADEAGGPDAGFVSVWSKPTIGKNASLHKEAYSPAFRNFNKLIQKAPSVISDNIPGSPSPIASMVAGGMLGAGLGYGAGWVGEKVLPKEWRRQKLRRSLAVLGGLAGMMPGGLWGTTNVGVGRDFNDPTMFNVEPPPNRPNPYVNKDLSGKEAASLPEGFQFETWPKQPALSYIPVEEVTQSMYDPQIAQRMSQPARAMTAAVVQGASHLNNGARFITPMDMGKVTAGMGSGYLSGMIVGKVLGALTGMPETTQSRLKSTGMWAGLLANVAPMLFPRYG